MTCAAGLQPALVGQQRRPVTTTIDRRFVRFKTAPTTMAAGDAYNDTAMLGEADAGFFFCPPEHLPKEFPQFPVTRTYTELQSAFGKAGRLAR